MIDIEVVRRGGWRPFVAMLVVDGMVPQGCVYSAWTAAGARRRARHAIAQREHRG